MVPPPDLDDRGGDALGRHLRAASDAVGGAARLPSADRVRDRGDQRRRRRGTSIALGALVLAGGVGAGALGFTADHRVPTAPAVSTSTPPPTTPPPTTPAPTSTAVTGPALLDGSREVDLFAPDGRQLTGTAEGALIASRDAATDSGGVRTTWVVRPTTGGAVQLVGVGARVDGRDVCARVVDAGTVAFDPCDPSDPSQGFVPATTAGTTRTTPDDGPVTTTATFRSAAGYLVVSGGRLTVDPAQSAATPFTLRDAGSAQGGS